MVDLERLVGILSSTPSPSLTWYGAHRVELSGPVLARWLAKTANLLGGELSPGLFGGGESASPPTIRVDLGRSWQGVVWEVAAVFSGWSPIDEGGADVCVVADASAAAEALAAGSAWVLAHDLAPLALSWRGGALPPGVLDALGELMAQADAVEVDPGTVDLSEAWGRVADTRDGRRLLWAGTTAGGSHALVGTLVGLWLAGGSAVVVEDSAGADEVARIAEVERAGVV